jgi:DnaA family protein
MSAAPRRQLALNLRLREASSFENFRAGPNREPVDYLQQALAALEARTPMPAASWIYLWGESGCGKTHLLEAACRAAQARNRSAAYIPLREHATLTPDLLEDLEQAALVCVDDVDAVAGHGDWERALFALYERLRACGGFLLAAGRAVPVALGLRLPDLASRLAAGHVYALQPLTDADKSAVLRTRARSRGLEMSEEVASYLLVRYPRDLHSLFALLDRLDTAALAAQRRLTIPFVRGIESPAGR